MYYSSVFLIKQNSVSLHLKKCSQEVYINYLSGIKNQVSWILVLNVVS